MNEQLIAAFRRALELIQARGWAVTYSNGPTSPLNLRSAISAAGNVVPDSQWYPLYTKATWIISKHLGAGIQGWEFGTPKTPRTQAEVEQLLTAIIDNLEKNEAHYDRPIASRPRAGFSPDVVSYT